MIAKMACGFIGVLHLYFGYREISDWPAFAGKILGERATEAFVAETTEMAINQGVYNLFLAAGLLLAITGLFRNGSRNVALFLLACVVVAGVVGWGTMNVPVFLIAQSALALIAFGICWFLWPND